MTWQSARSRIVSTLLLGSMVVVLVLLSYRGARSHDPAVLSVPGEIMNLRFFADKQTLSWDPEPQATGYCVVRGLLSELRFGYVPNTTFFSTVPSIMDPDIPPLHDGFWYLVSGQNSSGSGSFGQASTGAERVVLNSCP